jgi:peptidyl-tRNA hydrolase
MDELIQYFVVNSELNMSAGKVAAQVAHVATIIAFDYGHYQHSYDSERFDVFEQWYKNDMKKIILKGKQKDLEKLIEKGFYFIRDNGLTEIPPNSLTVVGLQPMPKSEAQQYVKRLRLY